MHDFIFWLRLLTSPLSGWKSPRREQNLDVTLFDTILMKSLVRGGFITS